MRKPQGIELHQHGTIGRVQIANACHRLQFQQPQEPSDVLIRLKCDWTLYWPVFRPVFFLTLWQPCFTPASALRRIEINQQRLIAGKLESRSRSCRQAHSRESIPHAAAPLALEAFLLVSAKLRTRGRARAGIRVRACCARAMRRARTPRALRRRARA